MLRIAIVEVACLLPGAKNVDEFTRRLAGGRPVFLPSSRSARGGGGLVGEVDPAQLKQFSSAGETRLHQMCAAALEQLQLPESIGADANVHRGLVIGCMGPSDESSYASLHSQFVRRGEVPPKLSSAGSPVGHCTSVASILEFLQRRLAVGGPTLAVDTACASSLTALDVACQLLAAGECAEVIVGGVEGNLSRESVEMFRTLGVLAKTVSSPFDERSEGIAQSEGAVFFRLEAREDLNFSFPPLAFVEAVEGSSNGSEASLFSPNVRGQLLATRRVSRGGILRPDLIEAHATGTPVGDRAEREAIEQAWNLRRDQALPIPVASTKAIFGHTKSAAGAVGALRAILEMQASPTVRRVLVQSAGFGGANYQMLLSKEAGEMETKPFLSESEAVPIALVAFDSIDAAGANSRLLQTGLRIPPVVIERLDPTEAAAILATRLALDRSAISFSDEQKENIGVIACCHTGMDRWEQWVLWQNREEISSQPDWYIREIAIAGELGEEVVGTLSCAISGRVANVFGFMGKNYRIETVGEPIGEGFRAACRELRSRSCTHVVLLEVVEALATPGTYYRRAVKCRIFALLEHARSSHLPVLAQLNAPGERRCV